MGETTLMQAAEMAEFDLPTMPSSSARKSSDKLRTTRDVTTISAEDMETQDPNEVTVQGMLVWMGKR